jgi:hypothetical protein
MTSAQALAVAQRGEHALSGDPHRTLARLAGAAAVAFSLLYLISDVLEIAQGGFSTARLLLTYAAEAAIPFFVLGLYAAQRPAISRFGLIGALLYAYSYVFFTSTVMSALVAGTPNYRALATVFGAWMVIHGLLMVAGGLLFGCAVVRARVLPTWTGACLMAGVVLVAGASGLPTIVRTVAEAVTVTAFVGMGVALLVRRPSMSHPSGHATR